MATDAPFRLLDLPRELRDAIYKQVLCDWPEWGALRNENQRATIPKKFAVMDHTIQTAILLANRQVYQEAKRAMIVGNQFVHITMKVSDVTTINGIFVPLQVPVVATSPKRCDRFKEIAVMSHHISTFIGDPFQKYDAIILRRDLDHFCKALYLVDGVTPHLAAGSKHEITIHDPFAKTLIPDYLNRKNQERLLLPYRQHLRDFRFVKIGGRVEPDLAGAVVTEVKQAATLPPAEEFLKTLSGLKELGTQYLRDNNTVKASVAWKRADTEVRRAVRTKAWVPLKEMGGRYFTDRVNDLFFGVHCNLVRLFMKAVEENAPDQDVVRDYARRLRIACGDASSGGKILGTGEGWDGEGWGPGNEQKAELYYLLAKALRLAKLNQTDAEAAICLAALFHQDDPAIQREQFLIEEWMAGR
ncbi:hypothetical protein Daus18300_004240 [Diaporthe australafricana]|uniref:Uncharacterized protein n=1 Tax=Diaporthe australafricana TaxID=127596 RepID=A0ABR3X9S7_9PEZI